MTARDKLIEDYEDALFALMMDEMAQIEGSRLLAENEALGSEDAAAVPPALHKRCLHTIRSGLLRHNSIATLRFAGRQLGRLAAAVFVTVALFSAAFAASPHFRAGTLNLLMDIDEDLVQWSFGEHTSSASTDEASLGIDVAWLPDGYSLTSVDQKPFSTNWIYQNVSNDGIYISLMQGSLNATLQTDKEDADYWCEFEIHGSTAVAVTKNNTTSISWLDSEHAVLVDIYSDGLSLEQLQKFAEKISIIP